MRELLLVALVLAGVYGVPELWQRWSCDVAVVTYRDGGMGSLRAAMLEAGRCQGYVRVHIAVPDLYLDTVLPPLHNRYGILLEGVAGGTRVHPASGLQGTLVELDAPALIIQGLRVRGSGATAIRASGRQLALRDLDVTGFDQAVLVAGSPMTLQMRQVTLSDNGVGLYALQRGARLQVADSVLQRSTRAAVLLGKGDGTRLRVLDSTLSNNRVDIQGSAASIDLQGSHLLGSTDGAIVARSDLLQIYGSVVDTGGAQAVLVAGPARVIVHESRLRGPGIGIHAIASHSLAINDSTIEVGGPGWVVAPDTREEIRAAIVEPPVAMAAAPG